MLNLQRIKKSYFMLFMAIVLAITMIFGAGYSVAAFMDRGSLLGSTFSVGSADIKLLDDLGLGSEPSNLLEELPGPSFTNIGDVWEADYPMKIYNNATSDLLLTSNADYETANDPEDLRQDIYVEPLDWNDANGDGEVEESELGTSYGRKTIVKWKTEGFDMGTITTGEIKGIVLRFSTDSVSDTKQGATAVFDFIFNSVGL